VCFYGLTYNTAICNVTAFWHTVTFDLLCTVEVGVYIYIYIHIICTKCTIYKCYMHYTYYIVCQSLQLSYLIISRWKNIYLGFVFLSIILRII